MASYYPTQLWAREETPRFRVPSQRPERYSGRDLYVANLNDMIDAGLAQATLFLLDRTIILPWTEEWFTKREDGTGPVVGRLNSRSQEYLRIILGWRNR